MTDPSSDDERLQILQSTCDEARYTVEQQIETINDIDTKSNQILRINALIIGALLTVFSISARSPQFSADDFINVYTTAGITSLIVSTGLAGLTYTASDTEPGIQDNEIRNLINSDPSVVDHYEDLAGGYASWIEFNDETNIRNAPLITGTILLLVVGVTWLSFGVAEGVTGAGTSLIIDIIGIAFLSVITLFSGIIGQIRERIDISNFTLNIYILLETGLNLALQFTVWAVRKIRLVLQNRGND